MEMRKRQIPQTNVLAKRSALRDVANQQEGGKERTTKQTSNKLPANKRKREPQQQKTTEAAGKPMQTRQAKRANDKATAEQPKQEAHEQPQISEQQVPATTAKRRSIAAVQAESERDAKIYRLPKPCVEFMGLPTPQAAAASEDATILGGFEPLYVAGSYQIARRCTGHGVAAQTSVQKQKAAILAFAAPTVREALPIGVEDYDGQHNDDIWNVSCYAMDIFNYYREREAEFPIVDYMKKQTNCSFWRRITIVDQMIEVHMSLDLNHDTLYLSVKLVDLYLSRKVIEADQLETLAMAAILIACKYDDRQPPLIEEFIGICDHRLTRSELIEMERRLLITIGYDLGIPTSYRFLLRYARCGRVEITALYLGRYILELGLMDYSTIGLRDSQMAAAALFIALRMLAGKESIEQKVWTPTLAYYSGYELNEFVRLIPVLNMTLHRRPHSIIKAVQRKYSHQLFFRVSTIEPLTTAQLLSNNVSDIAKYSAF